MAHGRREQLAFGGWLLADSVNRQSLNANSYKTMEDELEKLAGLLRKRLEVIGDHVMRENDPDRQLRLLQEVSEDITALQQQLEGRIRPRLAHFLENCSYDKALAWIEEEKLKD